MQQVQGVIGKWWAIIIDAHNDRMNDSLFYWISFTLFLMTFLSSSIASIAIVLSESQWTILCIPLFLLLDGITLHWYQCRSVRYLTPVPYDSLNQGTHINMENDADHVIDSL